MKRSIFPITPQYYSFGNASEEILWALHRAKLLNLKLKIIRPWEFSQLLGFKICNRALFEVESEHITNDAFIGEHTTNSIFIVKRSFIEFLKVL